MPPRPRKTAATKPDPNEDLLTDEPVQVERPAVEPADDVTADAAPEQGDGANVDESESDEDDSPDETPEPVAAPTDHWEVAGMDGVAGDPCRLCLPFGPPEGSGSVGCQHGQWVRVSAPDA